MLTAITEQAEDKQKRGESEAALQEWRAGELEKIQEQLISRFAYYDEPRQEEFDYHTQSLGGEQKDLVAKQLARLFAKLADNPPQAQSGQRTAPALNGLASGEQ